MWIRVRSGKYQHLSQLILLKSATLSILRPRWFPWLLGSSTRIKTVYTTWSQTQLISICLTSASKASQRSSSHGSAIMGTIWYLRRLTRHRLQIQQFTLLVATMKAAAQVQNRFLTAVSQSMPTWLSMKEIKWRLPGTLHRWHWSEIASS